MTDEIIITSILRAFLSSYFTSLENKDKISIFKADHTAGLCASAFQLIAPKL
jgi:hypothetical protein